MEPHSLREREQGPRRGRHLGLEQGQGEAPPGPWSAGSAAGAAGAGVLLHPPRSSNPINPIDSMPPREYAICLFLWPLVEGPGLKNACFFMILSLDKNFFSALP